MGKGFSADRIGTVPPSTWRPGPLGRRAALAVSLATRAAPWPVTVYTSISLVSGLLPVAAAWLTKILLDRLAVDASAGHLLPPAGALAALGVCAGLLPHATAYARGELDRRSATRAREILFRAVERFVGLARFEDPAFLDRLRLAQEGSMMPSQAVEGGLGTARSLVSIGGFLGSLFLINRGLAALLLVFGFPVLVAQVRLSRRRARVAWQLGPVERREFFYSDLLTTVAAAKEVRLFGIAVFLRDRMLSERHTADVAKRHLGRRELHSQVWFSIAAAVLSGGGLLWAVGQARSGMLSIGDITIFIASVAGVQAAVSALATEAVRAHQALLMLGHLDDVIRAAPDLAVRNPALPLPALRHGIEFKDVWFRYADTHDWVLRGVNLVIPAGQCIAVVGANGAGKSTLVKLLGRFYDPTRGAILWDGVDIRDVDPADLRQRLSAVFQDYMHYDLTAAENIGLGDLVAAADRGRIETAARQAGIHAALTELPRGYDTLLSRLFFMEPPSSFTESPPADPDLGVAMSGGQWQRLALARSLMRAHRDLAILDEPSAGLDPVSEHEIHQELHRHRRGRTSLLISHRLSAVRDADMIVVLGHGVVTEQGTHTELLRHPGQYARMFRLQASGYRQPVTSPTSGGS